MDWTIENSPHQDNVHILRWGTITATKRATALVTNDWHWDHPKCKRDILKRDLDDALKIGAPVFAFGDVLCAMQGKKDKRGNKSALRAEHQRDDYFNAIVDDLAEWLKPYYSVMAVISKGNHETAITKNHEIDLISMLVTRMRDRGSPVVLGGYGGWIMHRFTDRIAEKTKAWSLTKRQKYFHGNGGGGPVTKGVIQAQRRATQYADADLITTGHVHEQYLVNHPREILRDSGRTSLVSQLHVTTPGYKEEYGIGDGGFHIEGGRPPKPIGGAWVHFKYHQQSKPDPGCKSRKKSVLMSCEFTDCGLAV